MNSTALKWFGRSWMLGVYAFLFLPIFTLVAYSFNDSQLVTVWSHTSLRWYKALMQDSDLIAAVMLSLKIAFLSALVSVFFGLFSAFALHRYRRFTGRGVLSSLASWPILIADACVRATSPRLP